MDKLLGIFEGLFKDFTIGRFALLLFFVLSTLLGLFFYESYTASFRLERISSELEIIESLVELEKKVAELPNDSSTKQYFDRVIKNTEERSIELPIQLGVSSISTKRLIYQVLPWIFLFMALLVGEPKAWATNLLGVTLAAGVPVVIGYHLPVFNPIWLNNWLYPWGSIVLVISLLLFLQKRYGS